MTFPHYCNIAQKKTSLTFSHKSCNPNYRLSDALLRNRLHYFESANLIFSDSSSKFFETVKKDSDKTINYLS